MQIFSIFDQDGNGSIDFKEFMMATETSERGSIEDKVRGGANFSLPSLSIQILQEDAILTTYLILKVYISQKNIRSRE